MSTIRLGAAVNVREFQTLLNSLTTHDGHGVDSEALQDEFGRFRVWSGNLGVLQKGHSSLDYRLRDAPLLSNEVTKLLKELEGNLCAAYEILTGVRLPYEQQPRPASSGEQDENDSFFSDEEDEESDPGVPRTEIVMRFQEIVDIIDNLYKISVRIRAPTVRTRSLKAASYQPKDPETGVDLLSQYALFDIQHTQELVEHLRMPHVSVGVFTEQNDDLVNRLARAVTLRRRQFKYWRRHRDKLGISTVREEPEAPAAIQRPEVPHRQDTLEAQPGTPGMNALFKIAPSQKTGRTLLSGTEATHHHQSLDDMVDSKSVTSYAVTVKDLSGKGIDLPPPPKTADGDKDFECPYCFVICPARYGKGRPWRTHVLQDLQPYVCTYVECQTSDQLYRSRRDWIEHESSHRKVWRCPEHPDAVYKSQPGFEEHLKKEHGDSISEGQIPSIVKVGETSTVDLREQCPICFAVDMKGLGTLQSHIANHLERIAAFSLPTDIDEDSDGGSSRASRGGTDSSASLSISRSSTDSYSGDSDKVEARKHSLLDNGALALPAAVDQPSQGLTAQGGVLSESLIRALPDDSGQRLDLLFSNQRVDASENSDVEEDQDSLEDVKSPVEEHMAEREAFRMYLLSLAGAQSVRFYRRYGSWNGNINFRDGIFAARAMQTFDKERYPRVRLRQKDSKKETLKFSVLNHELFKVARAHPFYEQEPGTDGLYHCPGEGKPGCNHEPTTLKSIHISYVDSHLKQPWQHQQTKEVSFRSEVEVAQARTSYSDSSGSYPPSTQGDVGEPSPILDVGDIPNIRALYRSSELALRGSPSYVPNDAYNRIISFCYYDITRLKVDAIVNSSNRGLTPSRANWTLNSIIHRAAGPGLHEECSRLNRLKVSQSVLTEGHRLPCTHIIHVARPQYASSKGMGQYNLLTEGYRSALRLAMKENLKTLAFCCLGTGGSGFPARIAARIALQEVREFLDAHPTHLFERIVFCVYAEDDSVAYTDFFSDFFPPTKEDVDAISAIPASKDVTMVQEAYMQVNSVTEQVKAFSLEAKNLPQRVTQELSSIAVLLYHFKEIVSEDAPKHLLSRVMRYIDLLCSVMLAICGNMTEMIELARAKVNLGMPSHEAIWDDYNNHMAAYQGLTIVELIDISQEFARHLSDILERDIPVPHEVKTIGIRLGAWLTKQTGEGPQSARDHFEEVMLTREYQRDVPTSKRTGTVKLFQIETLSQLYEKGVLQPRNTQATPSPRSNHIVCLANEDITRLEVDILVSSTDEHFSGIGRLDRTVFLGGGLELEKECANHAPCKEGEVVLTGGYALPVKHVLHAILPAIYRTDALDTLRAMYRKILHMASYLRATSIAIPSLGTGMLNYPRRDSAAIAIREVKRFLENMDESNPIEKVIFVVYTSNDEFVYKSLLPAYFPPLGLSAESSENTSSSPKAIPTRSRTLFGTLGEAFRKLAPSKQTAPNTRPLEPSEEDVLIIFETHAQGCSTCSKISEIYSKGRDLCDDGYRFAAHVLRHLHMRADQSVYPLRSLDSFPLEVEIPEDFPLSLELLQTVEKSFRDPERDRPFVSNQPSLGLNRLIPEYTVYNIEITVSRPPVLEQTFDRIHVWSDPSSGWQRFEASLPTLHLTRGALLIRQGGYDNVSELQTRLSLSTRSTFSLHSGTNIVVDDNNTDRKLSGPFTLKLRSQSNCEMLLIRLRHAADNSPTYESQEESRPVDTAHGTEVTFDSRDQPKKAFARVSLWVEATESWEPFDAEQSEASLHVRPGSLEILQRASKFIWRLNLTSDSIIKQHSSVEILVDRVTTAGHEDAGLGHWKRIMLKCRSKTERNDLLASLQYAVDSSGRPSTPSQATSGSQHTLRDDQEALNPRWTIPPRSQWTKQSLEFNLSSVPTEGPSSASEQLRAATMDSNRTQKPTPSKPSASSASRDSLARLIDPTLIPLEELNIENYFEHEAPPALGIFPSTDTIFDDAEASAQRKITTVYTAPFTNIDKRLVHKSILEKYGLEFSERNECFHVFKVVEKEEVLRLHEETRNTPRFLGRAYDPDSN